MFPIDTVPFTYSVKIIHLYSLTHFDSFFWKLWLGVQKSTVYVFPFSKPEVIDCLILSERNVFSRIVWLRTDIHVYGIYWNHWLCMVKLDWLPSFIYRVKVSCSNRQGSKSNGVIYYRGSRIRQRRRRDFGKFSCLFKF